MKKLIRYVSVLITLITISCLQIDASINKFTILQRWDDDLQKINYIILFLGNNDAAFHDLNQLEAIKELINYEPNASFLFIDPLFMCEEVKNEFLTKVRPLERNIRMTFPKVTHLLSYALSQGKYAQNVDTWLGYYIKYLDRIDNLCAKDLAELIMYPLYQVEKDIVVLKDLLDTHDTLFLKNGYEIYLTYYDTLRERIKAYTSEVGELAYFEELEDFQGYLLSKYPTMNKINDCYDFFYLHHLALHVDFMVLNSLKAILESQRASKIFLFQEHFHQSNLLKEMLVKLGYSEVYTYTCEQVENSLSTINQLFGHIKESLTTNRIDERELDMFKAAIATNYLHILNVPAEALLCLMAPELNPDLFDTIEYLSMGPLEQILFSYSASNREHDYRPNYAPDDNNGKEKELGK